MSGLFGIIRVQPVNVTVPQTTLEGAMIRGSPKIRGYLFRGPNNKDYGILGVYIEVPLFWETTIR